MPIYITLMKLTEKGVKELQDAPKRIETGIKYMERLGGKLLGFYVTFGEYDYIGIAEAPNDDVVMRFLLSLGMAGNVRTKTLKAYSKENMADIIKLLNKEVPDVKIFVGGAVLNPEYAEQIGADYYCIDAKASVNVAEKFEF